MAIKKMSTWAYSIIIIIMLFVVFITLYPIVWLAASSVSDASVVASGRVTLYPIGFNLDSYIYVLNQEGFWTGYKNTILYTAAGTFTCLFMSTLAAYPLSKKRLVGRKYIMGFILITMFVNGGLIPNYLVVRALGLLDSIWAIILPTAISTYNMIIMRTFFAGIPSELEEAAMIDGLGTTAILMKIILPLSKPIMATMALFYGVGFWNDWFKPLIYLSSPEKTPVTLFLRNVVFGAQLALEQDASTQAADLTQVYMTIKSTTIILVVFPMLCVYPFIQKYFVKGIMIGSLKG